MMTFQELTDSAFVRSGVMVDALLQSPCGTKHTSSLINMTGVVTYFES
jgi:hypothetical protein